MESIIGYIAARDIVAYQTTLFLTSTEAKHVSKTA
jgi:hypothetical protein